VPGTNLDSCLVILGLAYDINGMTATAAGEDDQPLFGTFLDERLGLLRGGLLGIPIFH